MEADVVEVGAHWDHAKRGTRVLLRPTALYRGAAGETVELVVPVGGDPTTGLELSFEEVRLPRRGQHLVVLLTLNPVHGWYNLVGAESYFVRELDPNGRPITLGPTADPPADVFRIR